MFMPQVRISTSLHSELLKMSGRLQEVKGERCSLRTTIHYLWKFAANNQNTFLEFSQNKFACKANINTYSNNLNEMKISGLPTAKDIKIK